MAFAAYNVAYFRTEKGKDAVTFRGYCYRLDRVDTDGVYWQCLQDSCRRRIKTDSRRANPAVLTEHNHPADLNNSKVLTNPITIIIHS